MMETTQSIQNWRSIRRYKNEPAPEESLKKVLEAGRRAPSWENVQPWHFIVVDDAAIKDKLVKLAKGQKFIAAAPVVIAVCGDLSAWDKPRNREALLELVEAGAMKATPEIIDNFILKDPVFCVAEHGPSIIMARTMEQLGIAYGFMCIEAVNQGLGMCIVGAFGNRLTEAMEEFYEDVCNELGLPKEIKPFALLTLGVPDEQPAARPRKPLDKIVSRNRFGNPL